jgi:transcriptional regulator with XRE-family HTH domain
VRVNLVVDYATVVGRVVRALRVGGEHDQAEVAAVLGLTQSGYSRIERGRTAITVEQLATLAPTLGTEPSKVLSIADHVARAVEREGGRVTASRMGVTALAGAVLDQVLASAVRGPRKRRRR